MMRAVTGEIVRGMQSPGIELILLRGPTFASWGGLRGPDRNYADTDVLVPPSVLARVAGVSATPERLWEELSARTEHLTVGGAEVVALDELGLTQHLPVDAALRTRGAPAIALGLALAYVWRPFWLFLKLPRAAAAVRRARMSARGSVRT